MNLRDLQYLVALADSCHFGQATGQCCVSQPTLSGEIDAALLATPVEDPDLESIPYSPMKDLIALLLHLLTTIARLLESGGSRAVIADSLFLKPQLLIIDQSRKRSNRSW